MDQISRVDDYLEAEMEGAERRLSDELYHYTSSDAAILGILATGTLRLSPFEGTNDLWESRPLMPNLEVSGEPNESHIDIHAVRGDVDRYVRGFSKVACFTLDWALPDHVMNREGSRGWNHLSLWAHYGAAHTGVCLRFDRDRLLAAFDSAGETAVHQFSGPVRYRKSEIGAGPYSISLEQAAEFGVDAVALTYARTHHERLFFRKHADWASESEFRLVRTDLSTAPFYLDVSQALTGVIIGDAFPRERLRALRMMLDNYENVEVQQARFQNRMLFLFDAGPEDSPGVGNPVNTRPTSAIEPRREGDLATRLAALELAEQTADRRRADVMPLVVQLCGELLAGIMSAQDALDRSRDVVASMHQSRWAIPVESRLQRPGVSDDLVADEAGFMLVGEHQPQYSFTIVVGVAVQARTDGGACFHAVIEIEEWSTSRTNPRWEIYRDERLAEPSEAVCVARDVRDSLLAALPGAYSEFDRLRTE